MMTPPIDGEVVPVLGERDWKGDAAPMDNFNRNGDLL